MRITWTLPEELVPYELMALRDEGYDVSEVEARWAAAGGPLAVPVEGASVPGDPALRELALELLDTVPAPVTPPLAVEPEPPSGARAGHGRLLGAWTGRAVGCVLGKPVEKIPRRGIREILGATGRWPLTGYFTAEGLPPEVAERWPWNRRSAVDSLAENIDGTPEDDDLNFALLALRLLEARGHDLTSADVAQAWLDWLPAGRVFTAERVAYRNLLLGLTPPETALRHNPFREWIGAQIRTDAYGWATPGRPRAAAALAYRDAVVSHAGDGVTGAMWVAAMTATAVVASTVDEVLDAGEAVLPDGPFAAAVREARALAGDWEAVVDAVEKRHGHLHWVHARNNAALVAAALAHSGGDFDRGIRAVVSGGWDTDSNGATVGSILGALSGASAIGPQWTAPLKGRLRSSVGGFDGVTFEELARRTAAVAA
ncbi:ADP-ribosylglycohydrolase family protein [Phytohabitans suffuscus]